MVLFHHTTIRDDDHINISALLLTGINVVVTIIVYARCSIEQYAKCAFLCASNAAILQHFPVAGKLISIFS